MSLFSSLWEPVETTATTVPFTPTGAIAATTVQGALAELDSEKQPTTLSLTDIGADLADDDTAPVYDLSATANRKSALFRFWTYIASKLSAYTGILGASRVEIAGDISSAAWTTSGLRFKSTPGTLTDTSSSGTVATAATNKLGGNTIAASSVTTFTDYATLYLDKATAGAKVTITNLYSLITTGAIKATGGLTLIGTTATDTPTLGAELLTTDGWTVGAGWAESPDDTFAHTGGGGTATLAHSATIANSTKYQLTFTITGRTAGTITVEFGGATIGAVSATGSFGPTTSSTAAFTVTPTNDFDGTCVFSLKAITAASTALVILNDSTSTPRISIRANNQANNQFVGHGAGLYCTTGYYNIANGAYALYSNTTGYQNTASGVSALEKNTTGVSNTANGTYVLQNNTTGINNTANGVSALDSNTTGYSNTANGVSALYYNTTGYSNTANGVSALYSNTTGVNNTANGYNAGCYVGSGTTANQTSSNSIYIGYDVRAAADGDTNEIVIGNSTVGLGSNSTTIGNSSTTLTRLYGNIATGVDSPSAKIHAIATTEQLRLGYDATKYVANTVDSSGNLLIDAVGAVKIGDGTNYANFATDGTLTLVGTATAWDDLMIPGHAVKATGSSPPDLAGGFAGDNTLDLYVFDGGSTMEQVFFTVQMPHKWKEGSTIYPHVHISPTSTNTGDTNERVVRFTLEYTWANIDATFGATAVLNMDTDPFVPNTSQWKHLLCKNGTGISGSGKTISSMLVCRLFRDPTDAADTYPQDAAFLQFDIHYEIDSIGSSLEYIK